MVGFWQTVANFQRSFSTALSTYQNIFSLGLSRNFLHRYICIGMVLYGRICSMYRPRHSQTWKHGFKSVDNFVCQLCNWIFFNLNSGQTNYVKPFLLANVLFRNQARCLDHEATGYSAELPIELQNWIRSIANSDDRSVFGSTS